MSLLKNSGEFRNNNVARNTFTKNDMYEAGHTRALSDGDEWGKGRFNESVGSTTDIAKRNQLVAKNKYNSNNKYVSVDES